MFKKIIIIIGNIIEQHKGIRRLILLTAYPLWLYSTYLVFVRSKVVIPTMYAIFTSVIATIIGFYFAGRNSTDKNLTVNNEFYNSSDVIVNSKQPSSFSKAKEQWFGDE